MKSLPLFLSLKKLEKHNITFSNQDKNPRTMGGNEYFDVLLDGETAVTYRGQGYWSSRGYYAIRDKIELPIFEDLYQEYAEQWAYLHPVIDYDQHGVVSTNENTKWKKDCPSFKGWLESHPIHSQNYIYTWDYNS